jgi:leucyl aminopeptidase (aminopeptidase T)
LFICKKAAKRPNNYKWLRSPVDLATRPVIHAKSALFQRDAMMNFRKMMLAAAATALVVSQVNAAEVSTLPAGKPAGVKEAQGSPNALVAVVWPSRWLWTTARAPARPATRRPAPPRAPRLNSKFSR